MQLTLKTFKIPIEKKRHRHNITNLPYGKIIDSSGNLVNCPREQKNIAFILKLRSEGASIRDITEKLMKRGILTKRGNKTWKSESLRQILLREEKEHR